MNSSRRAAEGIRNAQVAEWSATASKLRHVLALAESYRVQDDGEFVGPNVLAEQLVQVGGSGTPRVSEFLVLELGALLGLSEYSANKLIRQTLNLKYRHPRMWQAVQNLRLEPTRALKVANDLTDFPKDVAYEIGERWLDQQEGLPFGPSMGVLEECIAKAAPELIAAKEQAALEERYVRIHSRKDGTMRLTAQLDVMDAKYLDAAIEQMTDVLFEVDPEYMEYPHSVIRTKAFAALASPAYALAQMQLAAQYPMPGLEPVIVDGRSECGEEEASALRDAPCVCSSATEGSRSCGCLPATGASWETLRDMPCGHSSGHEAASTGVGIGDARHWARRHPAECAGHVCGTITVPLEKLQPKVNVYVHIDPDSLATGIARIEGAGVITTKTLNYLLGGREVIVRPVIDLPEMLPERGYTPSFTLREGVLAAHRREAFPFSAKVPRNLDLDHIEPYFPDGGPEQTRFRNLAPLSRRTHRAKTAGYWHAERSPDGVLWISPLGYEYETTLKGTRRRE